MEVHGTYKKNIYIKTMQFYRMPRYQKNKIKIKLSMTTSNYKDKITAVTFPNLNI